MRLDYLFLSSPNDLTNKEALTVVCTAVSTREATRARKKSKETPHTFCRAIRMIAVTQIPA